MSITGTITINNLANVSTTIVDSVRTMVEAALNAWGVVLAGSAAVTVTVNLMETTSSGRADGGSQKTIFLGTNGGHDVFEVGGAHQLRTGETVGGSGADIKIDIAKDYLLNELFFDTTLGTSNDIPSAKTDAYSVFLHEVGHALGFTGYYNEAGNSYASNATSPYDQRITLRSGEVYFDGPNVRQVMGDAIALTNNNYAHYGNSNAYPGTSTDLLTGLMNGVVFYRGYRYTISALDRAVMADLGLGTTGNDIFNIPLMHTFNGGAGNDTYYVYAATDMAQEAAGGGVDTVLSLTASYTLPNFVENLTLSGVTALSGTGNGLDNILTGNSLANALNGGLGNDILIGGAGADALDGGGGGDTASYATATGGVTVFLGGPQLNTGDAAGDTYISVENLTGSAFADILGGLVGGTVDGGDGNDWLYGTTGAETLLGSNGNDVLEGRAGADALNGGDGADVASYRNSGAGIVLDMVTPGNSAGDAAGDTLTNVENIWGSTYNDTIRSTISSGGQVYGFEGNDVLAGSSGNDVFYGGTGVDTLTGGGGVDDAFYLSWNDHYNQYGTLEAYEGGDTITDFTHGTDRIIVSRYWFGFGNIGGPAAALTTTHADFITSGGATSTRPTFFWNDVTKVLQFDPDGTGASTAVTIATLTGATLTLSDIWTA